MLKWVIGTYEGWVVTVVRIVLGVVFFAHGVQMALGWFGGAGLQSTVRVFRERLRIPAPLAALFVAAEFWGGLGLIVGFPSRSAALGIAVGHDCGACCSSPEVRVLHELVRRKTRPWN
jgi:putative oxidoreductase